MIENSPFQAVNFVLPHQKTKFIGYIRHRITYGNKLRVLGVTT